MECFNTTPNSLMDSSASPKVKTMEEGIRDHSMARNTSGVEGHARASRWD